LRAATDEDGPKIEGYAAVFYRDDDPGTEFELFDGFVERIAPGAFDDVLDQDVRGLFNHRADNILGRTPETMRLSVDDIGLRYEIDLADTTLGRDLQQHLRRGDVTGSSFSFIVEAEEIDDPEDGPTIRTITKFRSLFDVGPVTFPAYQATEANTRSVAEESLDAHRAANAPTRNDAALLDIDEQIMSMDLDMSTS
jgi:hypothetical protein